jgi:hypothetical protein
MIQERKLCKQNIGLYPVNQFKHLIPKRKHTHLFTNVWNRVIHSASQEILRRLWNPKVCCRVHKNTSVRQMNPVHNFPPYVSKMHPDNILPPMPRSSRVVSSLHIIRPKCCIRAT